MAWWDSPREPALLPRAEGQKPCDKRYSKALLGGRGWSVASSLPQALGNGNHCPLRSVSTPLSPHPPVALPFCSQKKTPFGILLSSESFPVGEKICLRNLPLPPLAVILGPSHFTLFQALAQKCFTLHTKAFMCNLMNRSNPGTASPCHDS